jgi:hypothetical protein
VFHVELRRFPHLARAFNLSEEELRLRIVLPWVRGAAVRLQDRSWDPDRSRLTIYEGPEIAAEERGLGRGWAAVTRDGEDVTARMTASAGRLVPQPLELKRRLMDTVGPMPLWQVVEMAGQAGRASERLAVAEQALWELLHQGRAALIRPGGSEPAPSEEWEALLLDWRSWLKDGAWIRVTPES